MMEERETFFSLLEKVKEFGNLKSPDFVAFVVPLLQEVKQLHENNEIAFVNHINGIGYNGDNLVLNNAGKSIQMGSERLFVKPQYKGAIEVSGKVTEHNDLDNYSTKYTDTDVYLEEDANFEKPVFLLNYQSWDYAKGHYDPLTDVFVLGQILASLAFGLDFRDKDDLEQFVVNRKRLYFLNKSLHPTLLNVVFEMTNLYREDRTANLEEAITKLKNYREYNPENYVDLTQTEGFRSQDLSQRSHWILAKLKNRLFDVSRRNKLLYFKEQQNFLNLTIGSVPLLLDYKNIKENDLIYWNENFKNQVVKSKKLKLNQFLEFDQNRFLAPTLNTIRLEARRSQNEYGFSQMRVVIAFLHWYNFKEDSEERITSPLLLLPAEIVKKKGVKDQYTLEFSESEAQINPVLSNYLKELYDISLPDFVDLDSTSIEDLIASIETQIANGGTGITLEWRKQPKIQLIHSIAKKSFNLRNSRLVNKSRGLNIRNFAYSYDKEDFQPLGLQIFRDRIKYKNNALEYIINENLKPSDNYAVAEKHRSFYTTDNDGEINPLVWEIDTCNVTIGNFNYRKMSLVRDYNEIIDANTDDDIFEQLFSEFPIRLENNNSSETALEHNYPIIASDPTQTSAIQIARSGESYIIQGPPGTGKSQTITNLIADYIARDKKILFVCEKRAALDVVFHRLKNKHLDELCCLIHDSQTDKKSFIFNLKDTYEAFIGNKMDAKQIKKQRDKVIETIHNEIEKLSYYHKTMNAGEVAPVELFEVLHATNQHRDFASAIDRISYASYAEWKENREWIMEWFRQLKLNNFSKFICDYPFAQLSADIINSENPKAIVLKKLDECTALLDEFSEVLDDEDVKSEHTILGNWSEQFELANQIKGLFEKDKFGVFTHNSAEANELDTIKQAIDSEERKKQEYIAKNKNWKSKFNKEDASNASVQWTKVNGSIFKFLNPSFYKLKGEITKAYNFAAHKIKPEISNILTQLNAEYACDDAIAEHQNKARNNFGFTDFSQDYENVKTLQTNPPLFLRNWVANNSKAYIKLLLENTATFQKIRDLASSLFGDISKLNLAELDTKLTEAKPALASMSAFTSYISNAQNTSKELQNCFYTKRWELPDFEFHLAYKSLTDIYEKEVPFSEMDEDGLQVSIARVNALLDKYYENNVSAIRARVREQFLDKIRITESTAAQLTTEEKVAKKNLTAGRRILENEFGKTMRYKSIRELASGEASELMNALKPVWLMSPLSVSDTMPIDPNLFDVVIYDEASQITVEEGVPALFRTHQTIIVGDEMQMPPTNFFSTQSNQDEEEEEIENRIGISLDADSILNQAARKLYSVMLGWHYRSRRESLISFSNAAFYKRGLLTIPDNVVHSDTSDDLEPILDIEADIDLDKILNRSISFHYLENANYEKRKNRDEADYIAKMVCTLLKKKTKRSIGVVAFSMEQQSEIESALDRLAMSDSQFETLLESEYQRVDEDQFNGLFIKNLENVQGDERDIIIMSVCYGYNSKGKMLMNFGPINRRGGEKRLNVIFSRAKQNMVVVSSIQPQDIKNDYNEGANYFKRFLTYAKYISEGKLNEANLVLDGLYQIEEAAALAKTSPIINQLKKEIEAAGYEVDVAIGQSHFKCDLGIRKPGDSSYLLGILLDNKQHYFNENVLEQYCQRPEILNAFGWNIYRIFSKDWLEKKERVLAKLHQMLEGSFIVEPVLVEDLVELITEEQKDVAPSIDALIAELNAVEETQEITSEKEVEEAPILSPGKLTFERLEFSEGASNKYWQVGVDGTNVHVQYGRIGNNPQTSFKTFETEQKALAEKEKMMAKKVAKGYVKV